MTIEDLLPPPLKRIRYVFTVIMPEVELPDDPLAQNIWLAELMKKLNEAVKPDRIGVTAIMGS
jgi:hypothetical protein